MLSNDVKLLAVYDQLEKKIDTLQLKHGVDGSKGDTGPKGATGPKGTSGTLGISGVKGVKGDKGDKGDKGNHGDQGISVTDATVDLDNHLVLTLSDGKEIDAGDITGDALGDRYYTSGSKVSITNSTDPNKDFKNPLFTYTDGALTLITYKTASGDVTATKTLTYSSGVLTQLVEVSPTGTITKIYHYTDGVLVRISQS